MPRKMPAGLMTLLARPDKQIESHSTLQISINNGDVVKDFYFATAELIINGAVWEPQLIRGSQIRSSLTRASDQATAQLQNVDTEIGREFLALGSSLYGAQAKIGRHWIDKLSRAEFHKVMLTGPVTSYKMSEQSVEVVMVSEPYANVSVGATRRVTPTCQWQFRNPNTCGYAGPLLTCNFLLNHADGCEGRHGTPLKRARIGAMSFLNSKSRLKTI